ncbi:putative serine/threonine-protein kinase-like protein CCR3 [Neltuma alba]|uniref:putative serine/threonine-protein kinase-like protein CCR3 n=1 Tax=Neltuma alba TaxID=207710 RepID=UPI0010A46401|nr:putative serine/threonine-protein kinase-like protein CCR3 [Prosopis alba]
MTNLPSSLFPIPFIFASIIIFFPFLLLPTAVNGLGSASTTAVVYGTGTFCGIVAGEPTRRILCYQNGQTIQVLPNVSFQAISGGRSFFCGLLSGGFTLLCWDTTDSYFPFQPRRLYYSSTVSLTDLTVGDTQVCARALSTGIVRCWRGKDGNGHEFPFPNEDLHFRGLTSGCGFSCGILKGNNSVHCWGQRERNGDEIQRQFRNLSMSSLVGGESHVCGLTIKGVLVCQGSNNAGQLNVPFSSPSEFSSLALGANFTCALRSKNGLVMCWGRINRSEIENDMIQNVSFESIVAGLDYVCGLLTGNLSVICWGPGWSRRLSTNSTDLVLPMGMIIPGPCIKDSCSSCGTYPNSEVLCHGSGRICYSCQTEDPLAVPLPITPPPSPPSPSSNSSTPPAGIRNTRERLISLILGSAGAFVGLCSVLFCLWFGTCRLLLQRKSNNLVQATASEADADITFPAASTTDTTIRSFSSKRQNSRTLRSYRRSGSSSIVVDRMETFTLSELAIATNNFSIDNKIGSGSFGIVYRGKLEDGREVAIKRGETCTRKKKFQERESAFDSEVALLSRLHHKHLVGLLGFCEQNDEKLLVYEYMTNGSLHYHLHNAHNTERTSSVVNSWRLRIKIALDAARGIEYLHNYAVPSIIHRDIKSSNILLDSNWNARVSDFGLSLMGEEGHISTKAVGTVGYIDPEYYVMNVLTTKSDVYGLGVVMLELLTGKRAVFREEEGGASPVGVVEYAGPRIGGGELWSVLDYRVGEPEANEVEGLEIMAYSAMHCVNLEGKERPSVSDIVANLERALASVEGSPGSLPLPCSNETCDDYMAVR